LGESRESSENGKFKLLTDVMVFLIGCFDDGEVIGCPVDRHYNIKAIMANAFRVYETNRKTLDNYFATIGDKSNG
jgi:hypothetical protein